MTERVMLLQKPQRVVIDKDEKNLSSSELNKLQEENKENSLSNSQIAENGDTYTPYFKEYKILIEYKHLPKFVPSGIYVLPSFDSLSEWYGVIFIRQGMYRKGIFKFIVNIPTEYPQKAPLIRFFTPVFHPQVDPVTFELDLSKEFPIWDPNNHYIWHALTYVKKIFYKVDTTNPLNKEAADLYNSDRKEFLAKVTQTIQESVNQVYINPENTSMSFSEYTPEHDAVRRDILKIKEDEEKDPSMTSWMSNVASGFSKILNIKY